MAGKRPKSSLQRAVINMGHLIDEGWSSLTFYIMGCEASLPENLPIGYIQAILVCFIDEDHLGKLCEHGLVMAHCLVTVVIFL